MAKEKGKKQGHNKSNKYITNVQPKLEQIEAWCRKGAIEEDIARNLNVGVSTFSNYKRTYPELREALSVGKAEADITVESALFKRAVGYEYEEVREELSDDGWKTVRTKKFIPPDVTAQIFWLKNRVPQEWRDKQDVQVSGEINNPCSELSTEELRKLAQLKS